MRRQRKGHRLLALILGLSLVAAACGGDDDDGAQGDSGGQSEEAQVGGEIIDLGTFTGDPPENIDPALNSTLNAYQVVNALYDGLTDIDASDPENPETKPMVAESFEANEDATEWTFRIREGLKFSNGEEVLPSSFARAWERASDPDFAGQYSYLFNFIEGGAEKLAGEAETLSGVTADDEAMTLTVRLSAPYSNFHTVAGFQLFMPMPSAVEDLADQADWDRGEMIGNGPFMLESPRTDTEIVLVPNPQWDGTRYTDFDLPERPYLDRVTLKVTADRDTSYNSFEAGEGDITRIPAGRFQEAIGNYATTVDVQILGSYYWDINENLPQLGGDDNLLLRKAIMQAIDRDEINEAVYEGTRAVADQITPPGIPGFGEGLCDDCTYDPDAARQAFEDWQAEGNELTEPLQMQFNAGQEHDQIAAIIVDNLSAIGIDAQQMSMDQETYFTQLAEGACIVCRSGWYADYPTYDNFMYDNFHSDAADGGNNFANYKNPEFDDLVDRAKETTDPDEQAQLFQDAERVLLEDAVVIPLNWYTGDYAYNGDTVGGFDQSNLGLIPYEQVFVKG
jgi:oligopeptide transport system substrate-binding protein